MVRYLSLVIYVHILTWSLLFLANYETTCVLPGNKVEINGVSHLLFEAAECSLEIEKAAFELKNLFNGDPVLGKATNNVLNENYELLLNEIKPKFIKSLAEEIKNTANKITLQFDYDELFP